MRRADGRALQIILVVAVATTMACATPNGRTASSGSSPSSVESTAPAGAWTPAAAPTEDMVTASPTAAPVVEVRTVTETQSIPFKTTTINDPSLAKGTTKVKTQGVSGTMTLTYEVTFTDGIQTGKKLLRKVVTKAPITKVVLVGTKQPSCDPNYSGACVPIASDVDCAGGSGNGPAYVDGPVYVVGSDIYDLDSDNDGVGCE